VAAAVPPDAEAEVADADGESLGAVCVDDAEPVCVDDADEDWVGLPVALAVLVAGAVVVVAGAVAVVAGAAGVEELAEGELEGDGLGEGDGEGEGDGLGEGDGEGEGEGDAAGGSAWHTGFVAVVACGTAYAVPSMPRVRKPPLSVVTAATRTCPKPISIACLR
jgi:hypothetical protein